MCVQEGIGMCSSPSLSSRKRLPVPIKVILFHMNLRLAIAFSLKGV